MNFIFFLEQRYLKQSYHLNKCLIYKLYSNVMWFKIDQIDNIFIKSGFSNDILHF